MPSADWDDCIDKFTVKGYGPGAIFASSNSQFIAFTSGRSKIKVLDTSIGRAIQKSVPLPPFRAVTFTPDGSALAMTGPNGIHIWKYADSFIRAFTWPEAWDPEIISFHPDGRLLLAAEIGNTAKIWSLNIDNPIANNSQNGVVLLGVFDLSTAYDPILPVPSKSRSPVLNLAISQHGNALATTLHGKLVGIWVKNSDYPITLPYEDSPDSIIFLANDILVIGTYRGKIDFWAGLLTGSPRCVKTFYACAGKVVSLRTSSDGTRLVSSDLYSGTTKLWDTAGISTLIGGDGGHDEICMDIEAKRKVRHGMVLEGHDSTVQGLRFSPDGKMVASKSWKGELKIWNITDGKCLLTVDNAHSRVEYLDFIHWCSFSTDNRLVSFRINHQAIEVWNLTTLERVWRLRQETPGALEKWHLHQECLGMILVDANPEYTYGIEVWNISQKVCVYSKVGHYARPIVSENLRFVAFPDKQVDAVIEDRLSGAKFHHDSLHFNSTVAISSDCRWVIYHYSVTSGGPQLWAYRVSSRPILEASEETTAPNTVSTPYGAVNLEGIDEDKGGDVPFSTYGIINYRRIVKGHEVVLNIPTEYDIFDLHGPTVALGKFLPAIKTKQHPTSVCS